MDADLSVTKCAPVRGGALRHPMNALPRAGSFQIPARKQLLLPGVFLLLAAVAGCNDLVLESAWPSREILVDGRLNEWDGATHYLEEYRVSVGLLNDGSRFFMSLSTPDPDLQRQILAPGFSVRLSPEGNKDRFLTIRFPLGLGDGAQANRERNPGGGPPGGPAPELDLEALVRRYQGSGVEMEILVPDETSGKEKVVRLGVDQAPGIRVALGNVQGNLVYELEVPLTATADIPYTVDPGKETALIVELTSGLKDRVRTKKKTGDMRPPEGIRGGPGPGGMPGGPPGGMRMGPTGPLEVRAKVHLATKQSG